jgi:copper transport protein
VPRRLLAIAALTFTIVVVAASPAAAHATLLATQPQAGGVYDKAPGTVSLRFNEPVEVAIGGIRVFTGSQRRVVTGAPQHPRGKGDEISVSLPKLRNGTYVATWRVISADSHPVEGAFTFQVGPNATLNKKNAQGVAAQLLATTGGSTAVGVVYGIDRAVLYGSLAVLIGGVLFLVVVWPRGRDDRRATRIVWAGWIGAVVTSVLGLALEGVYAAGLPLSKIFDPTVLHDVLDTRYGRVALARLAMLALAYPLVRMVVSRHPAAEHPVPKWWIPEAALVGTGLVLTPGLSGHASTGIQIGVAIPVDAIHVAAMACWLGGLVTLVAAVLPRARAEELRVVLPRYSALALGAIVALIASGSYQAWRQVGSIGALKSTDYGRLLIAKLIAFAALVVAAAFSREVVNRRFRAFAPDDEFDEYGQPPEPAGVSESESESESESVSVSVGGGFGGGPSTASIGGPGSARGSAGLGHFDQGDDDGSAGDVDPEVSDEDEVRRLRRSVWAEVAIAVVVLTITALLVNAAPARSATTRPISLTLKSAKLWVYVDIAPGVAGPNDIHVTAFPTGGGLTTVQDMQVQLVKAGADLPPFTVPIRRAGPGHYYAPLYSVPYPGAWQMIVRVQVSATDEVVLQGRFSVR